MADPTLLDPNYPLTPEQYADTERLKVEGAYPTFNADVARFRPQAAGELQPYYSTLFDQLGVLEKGQVEKSNKTYEDLVKNLQESYNSRGRFFGGQAMQAEGNAAGDQAQRLGEIQAGFGAKRAEIATEQNQRTLDRAAQIQQQAFDDYNTNKKAEVEKTVSAKLAEYIPGYAKAIQAQLADENSPWLEIPLEEGVDFTTAPAPAAKPAAKLTRNQELQVALRRYKAKKASKQDIANLKKAKMI